MPPQDQDVNHPKDSSIMRLWKILGGVAGLIAVLGLAMALAQIWQANQNSIEEGYANATVVAYLGAQLEVQQQIVALEAQSLNNGLEATKNAKDLTVMKTALAVGDADYQSALVTLTAVSENKSSNLFHLFSPSETPAPRIASINTQSSAIQTPVSGLSLRDIVTQVKFNQIGFLGFDSSQSSSAGWLWEGGQVSGNDFRVADDGSVLTLISAPKTNMATSKPNVPLAAYPVSGDFQIKVRVDFTGNEEVQVAGMGVRSRQNPQEWISLIRFYGDYGHHYVAITQMHGGKYERLLTIPYSKNNLYFSIKRFEEKLTFLVGENDVNWYEIDADRVFSMPSDVDLFLYTYSSSSHGLSTNFSELAIANYAKASPEEPEGLISFIDPETNMLQSSFGWYPGDSVSSTYRASDDSLVVVSGPKVNFGNANVSAPRIEYAISGNFEATTKINFQGNEKRQVGAFGLRSGQDQYQWIRIERASDSEEKQFLMINRNQERKIESVASSQFPEDMVYLRIRYEDPLFSFFVSSDNENWQPILENFVMSFPGQNYLFFTAYSTSAHGFQVEFSDLTITTP